MFFFDTHNHLANCNQSDAHNFYDIIFDDNDERFVVASFCERSSWDNFEFHKNPMVLKSFGIHPQLFAYGNSSKTFSTSLSFLTSLLQSNLIFAVGEIGFDLFTPEFKATFQQQEKFFASQLALAIQYKKPVIIHCRKAMDKIFQYSKKLSQVPAVIFHSFPTTSFDAKSLLKKNINAFFSFGKHQIFNKKKSSIEMLKNYKDFPNRIFLETDAPYQTLKDEKETLPCEIRDVYEKAKKITGADFCDITRKSFDFLMKFLK